MKLEDLTFTVKYSKEDKEWVGLCDQFELLSWLSEGPQKALSGIIKLVDDVIKENR